MLYYTADEIKSNLNHAAFYADAEIENILMRQFLEQNKNASDEEIEAEFSRIHDFVSANQSAELSVSPEEQLAKINQLFKDNGLPKIYPSQHYPIHSSSDQRRYKAGVHDDIKRLAGSLSLLGVKEGTEMSDEQKEQVKNILKLHPFESDFQTTIPAEQRIERLNRFFERNGLAKIEPLSAEHRSNPNRYYSVRMDDRREVFLEQVLCEFEQKLSEISIRESSHLSEQQKEVVAGIVSSFFGKENGMKLLNTAPVSMLKIYFSQKPEMPSFAVETEKADMQKVFAVLESNFQKIIDIPSAIAKQAEFFQKNGCNAPEIYCALKMLKSQKSTLETIDPLDMPLKYPNNLLMELGIVISSKPVSAEFTAQMEKLIDEAPTRQGRHSDSYKRLTPLSETLKLRYGEGKTFEEIFKQTGVKSIVASCPRRIDRLKGNPTFIEKLVSLYEMEINPRKEIIQKHGTFFHEPEEQETDYPNRLLEEIGFRRIEGRMSEGFQSMLEDVIFNADNSRDKHCSSMTEDFYKYGISKSEIAEKYGRIEQSVQAGIMRMKRLIPEREVAELLIDELKNNSNVSIAKDSSLIILLHMEGADSSLETIYYALTANKMITFNDVIQAGMEQIQQKFSELDFTAAEFAKFTEIMTDFCKQNPEEWKYRTPEKQAGMEQT